MIILHGESGINEIKWIFLAKDSYDEGTFYEQEVNFEKPWQLR